MGLRDEDVGRLRAAIGEDTFDQRFELVREAARQKYTRPFLILDLAIVREKMRRWRGVLPRVRPHYAVKANPDPRLLAALNGAGCSFDVASPAEVHAALTAGADAIECDFWHARGRLELRHERKIPALPIVFDKWYVRWQWGELSLRLEAERCRELATAWERKGQRDYADDYRDRARLHAS